MAKDPALLSELHRLIGRRMEAGKIARPSQIVAEFLETKPLEGLHADFYKALARKELLPVVTGILKRVGMTDDPASPQMVLPGHTRLVKSYPVLRDGERTLVPIGLCTPQELTEHISLLRKQASGCENHAKELAGYLVNKASLEESQAKLRTMPAAGLPFNVQTLVSAPRTS